jgi:hypothetical protein
MVRKVVALFLLVGACSGDDSDPTEPLGPEICDNGVDDNGNGLVDCDDGQFCGGLQCATTPGDDDDDTTAPPDIEVDFDDDALDFEFPVQAGICNQPLVTITVVNRSGELEAVVDANCDLVNGQATIGFGIDGGAAQAFVVDEPLPFGESMELTMYFACRGVDEAFTTTCRVKADLGGLVDEVEFSANGTPQP